jgi:hypothetical protein
MSDREYNIYVEKRSFVPEESRIEEILTERRMLDVQEEERALEVLLP